MSPAIRTAIAAVARPSVHAVTHRLIRFMLEHTRPSIVRIRRQSQGGNSSCRVRARGLERRSSQREQTVSPRRGPTICARPYPRRPVGNP
jgi:hypothetical protein